MSLGNDLMIWREFPSKTTSGGGESVTGVRLAKSGPLVYKNVYNLAPDLLRHGRPGCGFLAEQANPLAFSLCPDGGDVGLRGEFLSAGDSLFADLLDDQAGRWRELHESHVFHGVVGEVESRDVLHHLRFAGGPLCVH